MDLVNPLQRAESNITDDAKKILDVEHPKYEPDFIQEMTDLFQNPTGEISLPSMTVMHERISELERRISVLEDRFETIE